MNRKTIIGISIAVCLFAIVVSAIEFSIPVWHVGLYFILSWGLSLGFATLRNAFMTFLMTTISLFAIYIAIKYQMMGALLGGIVGIGSGLAMYFGWITTHKVFSRSEYIHSQNQT